MRKRKIEHWRQEYNGFQPHSSLQHLTSDEVVARCSTFERSSKWVEVKLGFEVLDFDKVTLSEQNQTMSQARYVVSIYGAGLANMLFRGSRR